MTRKHAGHHIAGPQQSNRVPSLPARVKRQHRHAAGALSSSVAACYRGPACLKICSCLSASTSWTVVDSLFLLPIITASLPSHPRAPQPLPFILLIARSIFLLPLHSLASRLFGTNIPSLSGSVSCRQTTSACRTLARVHFGGEFSPGRQAAPTGARSANSRNNPSFLSSPTCFQKMLSSNISRLTFLLSFSSSSTIHSCLSPLPRLATTISSLTTSSSLQFSSFNLVLERRAVSSEILTRFHKEIATCSANDIQSGVYHCPLS